MKKAAYLAPFTALILSLFSIANAQVYTYPTQPCPQQTCPQQTCPPQTCAPAVQCPGAGPAYTSFSRFYLRAGAAFLIGDTPDTVVPTVGIGYEVPIGHYNPENSTLFGISVDYMPIRSLENGDQTISTVPELFYIRKLGLFGSRSLWGSIGIGARWSEKDLPEMQFHVDQNPAWMFELGTDFTKKFFGSVRFIGGWHPSDDGMFVTDIGYRF